MVPDQVRGSAAEQGPCPVLDIHCIYVQLYRSTVSMGVHTPFGMGNRGATKS